MSAEIIPFPRQEAAEEQDAWPAIGLVDSEHGDELDPKLDFEPGIYLDGLPGDDRMAHILGREVESYSPEHWAYCYLILAKLPYGYWALFETRGTQDEVWEAYCDVVNFVEDEEEPISPGNTGAEFIFRNEWDTIIAAGWLWRTYVSADIDRWLTNHRWPRDKYLSEVARDISSITLSPNN